MEIPLITYLVNSGPQAVSKKIDPHSTINFLVDSLTDLIMEYQHQLTSEEIKWILQKPKDGNL
jgi:hypothetical protein